MKFKGLLTVACVGFSMFVCANIVSAHGYVMEPQSRVYKGTPSIGLNQNVGQGMYEPQSIEAPKGFPENESSPRDGKIASGAKAGFEPLDAQTSTRWHKTDITHGTMDFTWYLTAKHKTESWDYYMTKQGWNENEPLSRKNLEKIDHIKWNGEMPEQVETQQVTIPSNRTGYHVILAVWNIDDTSNAFYQAIDVNVKSEGALPEDKEAPSVPNRLVTTHVGFNKVSVKWEASKDNVGVTAYEVLRNGQVVGTTKTTTFEDTTVAENSTYTYTVRALDKAGNVSKESQPIVVKTPAKPVVDTQAPTVPNGIMAHMTTQTSTMLHWNASTDNVGVAYYEILRNNQVVGTTKHLMYTDKNLKADTTYTYHIVAVDEAGNKSAKSDPLKVTTEKEENNNGHEKDTWNATTIYTGGEVVIYDGLEYKAKWWTQGNTPDTSDVWELVSKNHTVEWNKEKAYIGGNQVKFKGNLYQAKWWTKAEQPDISDVWTIVK